MEPLKDEVVDTNETTEETNREVGVVDMHELIIEEHSIG